MSEARTRRSNGEGTIDRRSDGRWEAKLRLPDGQRKSYYGKTRKEAEQKLAEGRHLLYQNLPIPGEQLTVEKFLATWLDNIQASVRPSTWERYEECSRSQHPGLGARMKQWVDTLGNRMLAHCARLRLD